jgi:hypothetical protein
VSKLPEHLVLHLESFNYPKAEEILDDLIESDISNEQLMFWRAISTIAQYTFGSSRAKEAKNYLKRSGFYVEYPANVLPHIEQICSLLYSEAQSFVTNTGQEAQKSSVGTITDPRWKMVTDTAITKLRVDKSEGHVLDVLSFLFLLGKKYPSESFTVFIDKYTRYFATNGGDIVKALNQARASEGLTAQSSSSCFVATSVYGSCNHPSVLQLRTIRDVYLLSSFAGRLFTRFYYRYGPMVARLTDLSPLLRRMVRRVLDQLLKNIY